MNSTFQPRFDLDKCSRNLAFILLFVCSVTRMSSGGTSGNRVPLSPTSFHHLFGTDSEDEEQKEFLGFEVMSSNEVGESSLPNHEQRLEKIEKMFEVLMTRAADRPISRPLQAQGGDHTGNQEVADNGHGQSPEHHLPKRKRAHSENAYSEEATTTKKKKGEYDTDSFFRPSSQLTPTFEVNSAISEYATPFFYKELSSDDFKDLQKEIGKPSCEFFAPPKLNDSIVRNSAIKESKGLQEGDTRLSNIRSLIFYASFPIMQLWDAIVDEEPISKTQVTDVIQRSLVLMGSAVAGLSSFRRFRFQRSLKSEYKPICNDISEEGKPSKYLFGDELSSHIKKLSEENKMLKDISFIKHQSSKDSKFKKNQSQRRFSSYSNNKRSFRQQSNYQKRFFNKRKQGSSSTTSSPVKKN